MATAGWLQATEIFGAILTVWFALVGWKLIPLPRHNNEHPDLGL